MKFPTLCRTPVSGHQLAREGLQIQDLTPSVGANGDAVEAHVGSFILAQKNVNCVFTFVTVSFAANRACWSLAA